VKATHNSSLIFSASVLPAGERPASHAALSYGRLLHPPQLDSVNPNFRENYARPPTFRSIRIILEDSHVGALIQHGCPLKKGRSCGSLLVSATRQVKLQTGDLAL